MATTELTSRVTPFQEVTAGTPPANAAAWASETSMRHVSASVDLSGLKQSVIEDERSQVNITDDEPSVLGIAGGGEIEVPTDFYMHGTGQSPADGAAITEDELSTLIEHMVGGMALGTSDELVAAGAHTTTDIELTDTLAVGTWVGLDDASGITHLRRVESTSAGGVGVIHVLHRALPFTPADADLARGCAVFYLDEDPLEDSSQGPYTFSWLYETGRGSQRETWECRGCKASLSAIKTDRNELAMISITNKIGSFITPETSPVPTHTIAQTGSAGSVVGPRTKVWIQDVGTTTNTTSQVSAFEVDPGIVSDPVLTQTEDATNMPGLFGYTLGRNPCMVNLTLVPHGDTPYTDFTARTAKSIQWERTAAAGSAWAIYIPSATYDGTPERAESSTLLSQALTYRARQNDTETTAIARSRMQIIRC